MQPFPEVADSAPQTVPICWFLFACPEGIAPQNLQFEVNQSFDTAIESLGAAQWIIGKGVTTSGAITNIYSPGVRSLNNGDGIFLKFLLPPVLSALVACHLYMQLQYQISF
jgi:hypothetical protein